MERVASTFFCIAAALLLLLLLPLPSFVALAAAAAGGGSSNCTRSCGNISIEYPFGVEPGCYHAGFDLTCNHFYNPPRLFLGDGTAQVLDISIPNGTVRINSKVMRFDVAPNWPADRNRTWKVGGPYFLSDINKITLVGCGSQVEVLGEGKAGEALVSFCTSLCPLAPGSDQTVYESRDLTCTSGIGCCQANIALGYSSYKIHFKQTDAPKNTVNYLAYVVDQAAVINGNNSYDMLTNKTVPEALPATLDWFIAANSSACTTPANDSVPPASAPECRSANSFCKGFFSAVIVDDVGYRCHCPNGYEGNPYVHGGCQDIDECKNPNIYPCYGECKNTQGWYHCLCPEGFAGNASILNGCQDIDECAQPEKHSCYGGLCINTNGSFYCSCQEGTHGDPWIKGGCIPIVNHSKGIIIGLTVSGGSILLILGLAAPFVAHKIKRHRVKKTREKLFRKNHGILLKHLISRNTDFAERMITTLDELEKATNNFDKTREVGNGGHGVVYKGILDLHVVAIKKSKIAVQKDKEREIDEFINEVAILSQVNHRNVVKLLGCCLETEVPLLVYEFISNGTLHHHLHVDGPVSLSWDDRLRISLEVARALSYLHSAISMPIFHRDIKSSNILLDDNLTAKVSDFGASRYISINQTGITTKIQGTFGYLDPMYYCTGRLTSKSDVYSFGVLLMELLTRKKPAGDTFVNNGGLVSHFASLLSKGNLHDIIDPQVKEEEDGEILEVASLAAACTKFKGEERPSMREAEMALENVVSKKGPFHNRNISLSRPDENQISALYMTIEGVATEASRQYSAEEEMLLSSNYPR